MTITDGGLLVGLLLIVIKLGTWWRKGKSTKSAPGKGAPAEGAGGGRAWRALAPFAACLCLGIILRVGVGGILGGLAGKTSRGENQLGDDGLKTVTGTTATGLTHPALAHLGVGSAIVVILLVALLIIRWRKATPPVQRDFGFGLLAGIGLAPAHAFTGFYLSTLLPALASVGGIVAGWK